MRKSVVLNLAVQTVSAIKTNAAIADNCHQRRDETTTNAETSTQKPELISLTRRWDRVAGESMLRSMVPRVASDAASCR